MSRLIRLEAPVLASLARSLATPLLRLVKDSGAGLPRPLEGPDDADLREIWERELVESCQQDQRALLDALEDPGFGTPGYALEASRVEAMARGCSAVRLALRRIHLASITDEALEGGVVDPAGLPWPIREPFTCFWFLGALQELLISLLDPESAEFGPPMD